MKKKLSRFFAGVLCCVFAILCVGCTGNDSNFADNLKEAYENGEMKYEEYLEMRQEAMSATLYGIELSI